MRNSIRYPGCFGRKSTEPLNICTHLTHLFSSSANGNKAVSSQIFIRLHKRSWNDQRVLSSLSGLVLTCLEPRSGGIKHTETWSHENYMAQEIELNWLWNCDCQNFIKNLFITAYSSAQRKQRNTPMSAKLLNSYHWQESWSLYEHFKAPLCLFSAVVKLHF